MTRDVSAATRGGPAARAARALIALVRCYQAIPRVGPPRCRFYPSCSAYAIDAFGLHGVLRGSALVVWRLARCHPFHPGGVEHVPGRSSQVAGAEWVPEADRSDGRELTAGVRSAGRS